jgi:RNA polymerase sigma-70 factor (ECF subfamily)
MLPEIMRQDDKSLAQRIAGGDGPAFAQFVDAYGARVHRLVRRYVAHEADAEDLTQEIFVSLYRSMGGFRGESKLSTWVYRIAMNHCLKHQGRTPPAAASLDDVEVETADPRADTTRLTMRNELRGQVRGAIDALSPLHRDIVILHELHGLTYGECAMVLQVPVGTVKSRLSNAFARLRASLGEYVLGEDAAPQTQCRNAVGEAL